MKKILPLILIFLLITVGLYIIFPIEKPGPEKITIVEKEDTSRITLVKNLFELKKQLEMMEVIDSALNVSLAKQKEDIDSLINMTLDLKINKVSLIVVTKKYDKIKIEKEVLHQKVDSLHNEYVKLYGENYKLSEELNGQRELNYGLSSENKNLKKKVEKASSVILTGIKVTGLGYTSGLLSKPKEYETNKSSKIKNIRFTCTLPPNELAKKENKNITFIMYSVNNTIYIKKDTSLNYTGREEIISCILKTPSIVEKGSHRVMVFMNNVQQYNFIYTISE